MRILRYNSEIATPYSQKARTIDIRYIRYFFLIALLFPAGILADEQKTVTVWNYYKAPPFELSKSTGFAHDFVKLLNREAKNRFGFNLITILRMRLNQELDKKKQGIVLFVNWIWMGKNARKKYLRTPALLYDRNEVMTSGKAGGFNCEPLKAVKTYA